MTNALLAAAVALDTNATLLLPPAFSRELRRADDLSRLAVAAAASALAKAAGDALAPEATGLFVGTAFGPLETNFRFLDTLADDGEAQCSPTLFSHSVHNAAAGYMAKLLDLRGPALTVTSFAWPFLSALAAGISAIAGGAVTRALVSGVDTGSPLIEEATARLGGKSLQCQRGAVAWVLIAGHAAPAGLPRLSVSVEENFCDPEQLLARTEETWEGLSPQPGELIHPMGLAFALTRAIREATVGGGLVARCEAPYGKALVSCRA